MVKVTADLFEDKCFAVGLVGGTACVLSDDSAGHVDVPTCIADIVVGEQEEVNSSSGRCKKKYEEEAKRLHGHEHSWSIVDPVN